MMKTAPILISALLFGSTALVQGQILALTDNTSLQVLNGGTFNAATGQFTRGGTDQWQGVVASFAPVTLANIGDSVAINFVWSGGSNNNNSGQRLAFGFFDGAAITGDNDTTATDGWTGYFHSIATRSSAGDVNFGVYRQGSGTQALFERDGAWAGSTTAASVNGAGGAQTSGFRPAIDQTATINMSLIATRSSDTQITFTTVYDTLRVDGSGSGSVGGISWNGSVASGVATVTSTHNIADGGPVTISGVGLVGSSANFTVEVIPEPSTYAALFGLAALGFVFWRRRRR